MSPEPAGSSPVEPEGSAPSLTARQAQGTAVRLGALLDRIQSAGPQPTVNPSRNPWVAPTLNRGPWFWFLGAFVATCALVLFWFFGADTSGGFIYAGF